MRSSIEIALTFFLAASEKRHAATVTSWSMSPVAKTFPGTMTKSFALVTRLKRAISTSRLLRVCLSNSVATLSQISTPSLLDAVRKARIKRFKFGFVGPVRFAIVEYEMRITGIEPAQALSHKHLKLARLTAPAYPQDTVLG